jgi:hypothetical protein
VLNNRLLFYRYSIRRQCFGGIAGINWGNVQRSFSSVTISASAIAGGIVASLMVIAQSMTAFPKE